METTRPCTVVGVRPAMSCSSFEKSRSGGQALSWLRMSHHSAKENNIARIHGPLRPGGLTPPAPTRTSPARPHIEHVAVLRSHLVDPALAGRGICAAALAEQRHQRGLDVGLHPAAVAADEDHGALLDQLPDPVFLRSQKMLHIGLRSLAARERGEEFCDAISGKRLELVGVEIILIWTAAAEEQHRRSERNTPRFERRALLQEAAEWREPGAGAAHDDRDRRIIRQPEAGLGLADRRKDALALAAAGEIGRADALVDAAARTRG